jgi:hypothetical protein
MSDELRDLYAKAGLLKYYFDKSVPRDLFRGRSRDDIRKDRPIFYPHEGFIRNDGSKRLPDVEIIERDGKKFVRGCRCIRGHYRGISVFDRINEKLLSYKWYVFKKDTAIPEALAITQDSDRAEINHYTIAPKDEMPLDLFAVWLKQLAERTTANS